MTINISRYVSINSAVLGTPIVATRQLIMNLFTVNPLVPTQSYITFTSAAEVGQYFGTTSEEYYRASTNYFGWVSKNNTTPYMIQFTRWVETAVPGIIFGYGANTSLSAWTAITDGSIGLTIGAETHALTGLDFSTATTLSAPGPIVQTGTVSGEPSPVITGLSNTSVLAVGMTVAGTGVPGATTILSIDSGTQVTMSANSTHNGSVAFTFTSADSVLNILLAAIVAADAAADWTAAEITYANNNFTLIGGVAGPEAIAVQPGVSNDISTMIGWLPQASTAGGIYTPGAIWSQGSAVETIPQTLTNAMNANNNFGTFGFCYTGINTNAGLTLVQYTAAANWNAALVPNVQFKFLVPVTSGNASSWYTALAGIGGVCMTLTDYFAPVTFASQYPEQCDGVIEAATNYNPGAINSVQNYMFQQFPSLRALVASDALANRYDGYNINYIGLTQNAGQQIAFYQRGKLQGGATDPTDSGVYANEQWLKSAMTAQIMNLLLSQSYVPANTQGITQLTAISQSVIQQALLNGTISVGKPLTALQINNITFVTGNNLAYTQVQNAGFYLVWTITPSITYPGEYQANYTLVYSKNDVIRFVQGTDDLV
jgi:hypothetical protein